MSDAAAECTWCDGTGIKERPDLFLGAVEPCPYCDELISRDPLEARRVAEHGRRGGEHSMNEKQEEANVAKTLADAELSQAHARLMNAQAAALEKKNES